MDTSGFLVGVGLLVGSLGCSGSTKAHKESAAEATTSKAPAGGTPSAVPAGTKLDCVKEAGQVSTKERVWCKNSSDRETSGSAGLSESVAP